MTRWEGERDEQKRGEGDGWEVTGRVKRKKERWTAERKDKSPSGWLCVWGCEIKKRARGGEKTMKTKKIKKHTTFSSLTGTKAPWHHLSI